MRQQTYPTETGYFALKGKNDRVLYLHGCICLITK